MAGINVNPTRMELSNLKKKLTSARKGHKLLKNKLDELMRRFMEMIHENQQLRIEIEDELRKASAYMIAAGSVMQPQQLETALMMPKQELELDIHEQNIMSVKIPVFETKFKSKEDIFSYGTVFTPCDLDDAVKALSGVFPKMIRLAEIEKSCQLLADEIEKTRRRVNALEHIMIPEYEESIRYISMKLSENERSTAAGLMKVKNMILDSAHNYS